MTLLAALPLMHSGDGDGPWPLFLLFWAALIGVAVWLLLTRRNRRNGDPLDRAREILAERFARGELSGEEYRARLDELQRLSKGASSGA